MQKEMRCIFFRSHKKIEIKLINKIDSRKTDGQKENQLDVLRHQQCYKAFVKLLF